MTALLKKIYKQLIPASSSFQFFLWKYRHVFTPSFSKSEISSGNLQHPHRINLLRQFDSFSSFSSVLEIGCGTGANLYLISQKYPDVFIEGIDINRKVISDANAFFKSKGLNNYKFIYRDLSDLSKYSDDSFDIILIDAVLIYVDDKIITKVANELIRISKKAILLVEFDDDNTTGIGYVDNKCWVRDYRKLFNNFTDKIEKYKINQDEWVGNWVKYGKIIKVEF